MLSPDERAALVVYCHDHAVAVCPACSAALHSSEIGTEVMLGHRDFCPRCRADLTPVLRQHLAGCTWIRVQGREVRERAHEARDQARQTSKDSQQLRDQADVLAREAEAAQQKSRDARRGPWSSAASNMVIVSAALRHTPGVRFCAPCLAKVAALAQPDDARRVMELPPEHRPRLLVERARCGSCGTMRRTLSAIDASA